MTGVPPRRVPCASLLAAPTACRARFQTYWSGNRRIWRSSVSLQTGFARKSVFKITELSLATPLCFPFVVVCFVLCFVLRFKAWLAFRSRWVPKTRPATLATLIFVCYFEGNGGIKGHNGGRRLCGGPFTWGTASGRALSASGGASGTHLSAGGYQAADWKPATGNQIMLYVGVCFFLAFVEGVSPLDLEEKY